MIAPAIRIAFLRVPVAALAILMGSVLLGIALIVAAALHG